MIWAQAKYIYGLSVLTYASFNQFCCHLFYIARAIRIETRDLRWQKSMVVEDSYVIISYYYHS